MRVQERLADKRVRILDAARRLVARGGFRGTAVEAVAAEAGVATGTVYRYFPGKAALFVEVVGRVSEREVGVVAAIAAHPGPALGRLDAAVRAFADRALLAPRLAYALIVEPSDPEVEAVRLVYRRRLADAFARVVAAGVEAGDFPPQDPEVAATCIVGAVMESLIGPLARSRPDEAGAQVDAIAGFCLRAVAGASAPPPLDVKR
jgi:AcrR family transcriptional regulator